MPNATTNEPGADTQAATQAAAASAATEARQAERTRINGILGCEEAKGRETMANHLAMNTEMSVEDAKKMLAVAPVAAPAASATNPFAAAMDASKNPEVGADAAAGTAAETQSPIQAILADHRLATGQAAPGAK